MKFFSCFQRYERITLLRRKWLPERLRLFTAIHNNRPIAYGGPHVKFRGGLIYPCHGTVHDPAYLIGYSWLSFIRKQVVIFATYFAIYCRPFHVLGKVMGLVYNSPSPTSRVMTSLTTLPNFPGDDVIDDVIDWNWWWEKVAHKIWWRRHFHVMRYSLSKLTAYTYLTAFISACLYRVLQLT